MSAADYTRCDICTKPIRPGMLMCLRHWRMVPEPLQQKVWRSWRAFNRAGSRPADQRLLFLREYRKHRDAAVEAVREQLAALSPTTPVTTPTTGGTAP